MDYKTLPVNKWDETHVQCWLESIDIKKEYVEKLHAEEVTGPVLMELDDAFLKDIGMKGGQIHMLIRKRNELRRQQQQKHAQQAKRSTSTASDSNDMQRDPEKNRDASAQKASDGDSSGPVEKTSEDNAASTTGKNQKKKKSKVKNTDEGLEFNNWRPFKCQNTDFKYVRDRVLPPESGASDLITPCHEYKSLVEAAELSKDRLQSKFASEVIRFASACMNTRTNGTIHFGVVDSVQNKDHKHGQIVGIKVSEPECYVEALKYIEKCFCKNMHETAQKCIHPPVFVEVISKNSQEQRFVVEVDVEPTYSLVKNCHFKVSLPRYNEDSHKVIITKEKNLYHRLGAKTDPVDDLALFFQDLQDRDTQREKAERSSEDKHIEIHENLGRKLSILLNDGKSYVDNSLRYILVTNRCEKENLNSINFLMHLNIFCAFDFDEDSNVSGLHSKYKEHHATRPYFLQDFSSESKTGNPPAQTIWIFCNGRNDFLGNEKPCDENTWIRMKKKYLKKAITRICDEILPKGSFIVLFLLLSPVQKPLVDTFQEFYTEMNGAEYIVCIAECRENYRKWANLAQASCSIETLEQCSVVGMKLSHIDATIQSMLPSTAQPRHLPVSTRGVCILPSLEEEKLSSLEILCVDQCEDIKLDLWTEKKVQETDQNFYRGKKIMWENFWLADRGCCGEIIEREACKDANMLLDDILRGSELNYSVARLRIFHHPGSGGSTIARQVLWKRRKDLRCAVVKGSYSPATVCEHALAFRDYEEKDISHCLPVLLLIEDYDEDYLDELRTELIDAVETRKIKSPRPYFILLCCKRSNDPTKLCKASPLDTVAVTHKLTNTEKMLFKTKLKNLEKDTKPEFILTFVLMCEEFNEMYVRKFVMDLFQGIDRSSRDTLLMHYVALLNFYVPDSFVSLSHCEAFLGLAIHIENKCRAYDFKSHLSDQARIIFVELSKNITYISSVRIIHHLVAKEILYQLSGNEPQSHLAMTLLQEKTLFENRFGQEEFIKFIRDLFIRRDRRSRGDSTDTLFSPFIEHVRKVEDCEKAIAVLQAAYEILGKDPFFAQQLARLHYKNEKFEDAEKWAGIAKSHLPNDSYILDTEGQVYRKWFSFMVDKRTQEDTPESIIQKIEMALKAIACFRAAQQAAKAERDGMNNAGYFGEVEIGCRLLKFLSTVHVFHKNPEGEHPELVKYLITDYIPEDIAKPWGRLHSRLKSLQQNLFNALEWISEDLSYFQTDKTLEKEEENKKDEKVEQIYNPRKWLIRQSEVYARFFISASLTEDRDGSQVSQLMRRMHIYKNGGGSVTNILSFLTGKKEDRSAEKLKRTLDLYTDNPLRDRLDDNDLINYIFCHITLACLSPGSSKLLPLQTLRKLSERFFKAKRPFPASAHFLLTLLYWPDEALDKERNPDKDEILNTALQTLKRLYDIKMKDIPTRKKRIYTHFLLGKGYGLCKIVHKPKIDRLIPGTLDERRMKWLHGAVWNAGMIHDILRRVSGWTKDGNLFIRGHVKEFPILPLHRHSVPPGNANVTFYLGFSFNGLVAFNIEVENN